MLYDFSAHRMYDKTATYNQTVVWFSAHDYKELYYIYKSLLNYHFIFLTFLNRWPLTQGTTLVTTLDTTLRITLETTLETTPETTLWTTVTTPWTKLWTTVVITLGTTLGTTQDQQDRPVWDIPNIPNIHNICSIHRPVTSVDAGWSPWCQLLRPGVGWAGDRWALRHAWTAPAQTPGSGSVTKLSTSLLQGDQI